MPRALPRMVRIRSILADNPVATGPPRRQLPPRQALALKLADMAIERFYRAAVLLSLPLCAPGAAPSPGLILKSAQLEVTLDRGRGLPLEYRLLASGAVIHGDATGLDIAVTLFRRDPRSVDALSARPASLDAAPDSADFHFVLRDRGRRAVSFVLRYALSNATLRVSLEDVQERPGFELIDVSTPDLATVREEDGPAWLAHGDQGGSVVALADSKPGHLPENRFWGGVSATLPVVMIGTGKALCVEEVTAFMDTTELAVSGDPGHRRAMLGTVKVYRVNGSLSYDTNTGPGTPRIAGNARTPNLLVGERPLCRLDFTGDLDGNGSVDWLDGAKLVRARMPEIPTHYYDDRLMYMIRCDQPKWPAPGATFDQSRALIHQIAALTDGAPQDVYLWGWQYRGKDTGYPAVAEVNPRLGGYSKLMSLVADARADNATVSFSDNYDDAYKSSPAWDPAIIARRPDGQLWESRNWTGENSYIIGLAKYMAGPGPARIRYTCDRYKLRDTYLIDVLSYYSIRNDWDPRHPASGVKNLREGRYKVLDGFRARGLDVVSEDLRYAFIGKISVTDNGPAGESDPFGGEPIPLVAVIYRHSAIWGFHGRDWRRNPVLYSLFYNGHEFPWLPDHHVGYIVAFYYQALLPWRQVHDRDIVSFRRDGRRTQIGLAGNSSIDIDWGAGTYSVTVNGAAIARDGDTFCPVGKDRLAFYSREAKQLSAALPSGWDPRAAVARELYADHDQPVPLMVKDGRVTVSVEPNRPVIVFRDAAAARLGPR
jgi:Endo-alpha-N-acetylgalactosaminidase